MRVLIIAKTRMREGRICVGAHSLDDFRSLRLFRHDGSYIDEAANLDVGDVWELDYVERPGAVAPHLEDVLVQAGGARRVGREEDLAALVMRRDVVWHSVDELFDGRLNFTAAGSAYVPEAGPLPGRSTGYWQPADELTLYHVNDKPRYRWTGGGALGNIRYVGVAEPDPAIPTGSLVRLSLSHPFAPPGGPRGYWLQLSGWFSQQPVVGMAMREFDRRLAVVHDPWTLFLDVILAAKKSRLGSASPAAASRRID